MRGVVVTTGETHAVCERYRLVAYKFSEDPWEETHVWGPGGSHLEIRNRDFDAMTPDEFESLVLPMVLKDTFGS